MEHGEKRIAVLIDADNVSADYIGFIFDELSNHGAPTLKRIYGDFTQPRLGKWKSVLLDYSIIPIQQYSYTYGKNSTDSALIIDAMDILYSRNVDGFCIVSSDSDFTRLASRLREAGMTVIGMGERKTPTPFVNACEQFKFLEVLAESNKGDAPPEEEDSAQKSVPSRPTLSKAITAIIDDVADADGWASLGSVGQRLNTRYPAFDARNYGFKKLSHLVDSFQRFEVQSRTMPNQHEAQTFIRFTDGKPGKYKLADGEGKHGKKNKKYSKEFSDGENGKKGGKKKKGHKAELRENFAAEAETAVDENAAAVADALLEAAIQERELSSEPPVLEDIIPSQDVQRQESAAEKVRNAGYMTVDEAIALFTRKREPEPPAPEEPAPSSPEPEAADQLLTEPPDEKQVISPPQMDDEATPAAAAPEAGEVMQEAIAAKSEAETQAAAEEPAETADEPEVIKKRTRRTAKRVDSAETAEPEAPKKRTRRTAKKAEEAAEAESPAEETPKKRTRRAAKKTDEAAAEIPETAVEAEGADADVSGTTEEPAAETLPKRRTRRSKAAEDAPAEPSSAPKPEDTPAESAAAPTSTESLEEKPKKRTRRTAKATAETGEAAGAAEPPEPEAPKKRTRRSVKAAQETADAASAETEAPKKRTRRAKAASDSPMPEEADSATEAETPKKRTRRTAKEVDETASTAAAEAEATPKKRTRRTTKKAEEAAEAEAPKKRTRRSAKTAEESAPADTAVSAETASDPAGSLTAETAGEKKDDAAGADHKQAAPDEEPPAKKSAARRRRTAAPEDGQEQPPEAAQSATEPMPVS